MLESYECKWCCRCLGTPWVISCRLFCLVAFASLEADKSSCSALDQQRSGIHPNSLPWKKCPWMPMVFPVSSQQPHLFKLLGQNASRICYVWVVSQTSKLTGRRLHGGRPVFCLGAPAATAPAAAVAAPDSWRSRQELWSFCRVMLSALRGKQKSYTVNIYIYVYILNIHTHIYYIYIYVCVCKFNIYIYIRIHRIHVYIYIHRILYSHKICVYILSSGLLRGFAPPHYMRYVVWLFPLGKCYSNNCPIACFNKGLMLVFGWVKPIRSYQYYSETVGWSSANVAKEFCYDMCIRFKWPIMDPFHLLPKVGLLAASESPCFMVVLPNWLYFPWMSLNILCPKGPDRANHRANHHVPIHEGHDVGGYSPFSKNIIGGFP